MQRIFFCMCVCVCSTHHFFKTMYNIHPAQAQQRSAFFITNLTYIFLIICICLYVLSSSATTTTSYFDNTCMRAAILIHFFSYIFCVSFLVFATNNITIFHPRKRKCFSLNMNIAFIGIFWTLSSVAFAIIKALFSRLSMWAMAQERR